MSVTGTDINLTLRQVKGSELTYAELDGNQSNLKTAIESHSHDEFASSNHNHLGVYQQVMGADDNYVTDTEKAALHAHTNKTALDNVSGINTGDQDLSGYSLTTHNHTLSGLSEKSYNSLTDKPTIPSITGLLNEASHDVLDHTGLTGILALGTTGTTACAGNDTRLSDARTPLAHTTLSHSDWPAAVSMAEVAYLDGVTSSVQAQLNGKENLSAKGQALGYCPLDGSAKVAEAYLPDSVLGQVEYQGTWNATTNTPTIPAASTANKGWYYIVATSGTTTINGISEWTIGDWIISNGTTWNKVDNTDSVSSVFGRAGAIVANAGDYTASQITNVPAGTIASTTVQAAINELDTEKASTIDSRFVTNGDSHDHVGGDGAAISLTSAVTGVLPVANGGTGSNFFSATGVLVGDGNNPITTVETATAGRVLTSQGTNKPAFSALSLSNPASITGVLPVANGGTGASTQNFMDLTTDQSVAGYKTFTNSIATAGNLGFTGTGNRITGDFSNTTVANRVMFQTSTPNGNTLLGVIPNGTGTTGSFRCFNGADANNSGFINVVTGPLSVAILSSKTGTGTTLPLTLGIGDNAVNHVLLSTAGNLVIKTGVVSSDDDGVNKLQVTGGIKTDSLKVNSSTIQPSCSADFGVGIGASDATYPIVQIKNTSAPVDKKYFRLGVNTNGAFGLGRANDVCSTETLFLRYDAGDNLFLAPAGWTALITPYIASATNYHQFNSSAGGTPVYYVQGSASDVSMGLSSKGAGYIYFYTNNSTTAQFQVANTASAVNRLVAAGAATAGLPQLYAAGTDTNIVFGLVSKGTYGFGFWTGGGQQFAIGHVASAVNYLTVLGNVTGSAPAVAAAGSDANIDIALTPKGTGRVKGTMLSFVCERNVLPAIGNTFAFGNGNSAGLGAVMPYAGKLVAVGISGMGVSGTLTADAYIDGVANSSYQISLTGSTTDVKNYVTYTTPLSFVAGTSINWQVSAVPTAGTGFIITFFVVFN